MSSRRLHQDEFLLGCMSSLLLPLCIRIYTTVRDIFSILLVVELFIYSKKYFLIYRNKNHSSVCKSVIITSPIRFNIALTNIDARLKQHCINVVPTLLRRCVMLFRVVSTSGTGALPTLCNVENPTSDFVSFSTSDQRYFNVDSQR